MHDYIEREAAIKAVYETMQSPFMQMALCSMTGVVQCDCKKKIKEIPAADVRPVVKSIWKRIDYKPYGHDYECSSCKWKNDMATHFCPNCGADMREDHDA